MKLSLRVAVIMGGLSGEHEISLKSGQGVVEALSKRQAHVEPIIIPQAISEKDACVLTERALRELAPDVVFLALHGSFGEDGTIQQLCEELHIPYTGSEPAASRLGMDKVASRKRFKAAGLAVPQWLVHRISSSHVLLPTAWAYPVVVKPINQGSSLGVSIVTAPHGLAKAIEEAGQFGPEVLIEEFVDGRELTVSVFGEEPLPVVEIRPHQSFFDFTAKYTPGATDYLVPAPLEPDAARRVQMAAWHAHQALGCRHVSRTDLMLRPDGTPVVLEVNTIPGLTSTSLLPKAAACIGISYEALCEQMVLMALPVPV